MSTLPESLRQAAEFLAGHPNLPHEPYVTSSSDGTVSLAWFLSLGHNSGSDLARQKADAAYIIRVIGGKWDKSGADWTETFSFTQTRGPIKLTVQVERPAVCERVVIATKEVTREVPAQPAVSAHTVTETVEEVEWRCEPLLAGAEPERVTA